MFRIPNYFQMNMTWDDAVRTIKGRGDGDLLKGMEAMNRVWERHVNDQNAFYAGETDEMIYVMTPTSMTTGCMRSTPST